ncbi:hypothetical protein [Methylocystis bryophila]|uniref:Uncharacterized protein n=1 Tax=Methylocystis bryophila TaxID=655015 RepID=A0A1W6MST4_9HYPH|nr:hypothetical protein [Methylocystis bryophila]ARN80615.1 hypothetical protein B1812_05500 [Methylocystis bryophila]BDV40672.1 hypothetical protein DSM21852_39250 [Methylocystis bryophila]
MAHRKHAFALLLSGALLIVGPAGAAELGPYFPLPGNLSVSGNTPREGLLKLQAAWLRNGLDNLAKAKKETEASLEKAKASNAKPEEIKALEDKLADIDKRRAGAEEELALGEDDGGGVETQRERKRVLLANVNQWIRDLGAQATKALKTAILSDGLEAMSAQREHAMLEERSDKLENATHDVTVEQWAATR